MSERQTHKYINKQQIIDDMWVMVELFAQGIAQFGIWHAPSGTPSLSLA